ncbi:RHS repeat-associated core domain-containing protein [Bacillus sp. AL-1R]
MTKDSKYNYFYNHENQLTKVTKVSDGSTVSTYTYDYRGLRISKTTPTGGTINYHWDDQDRLVRESDTSGNTLAQYIYNGDELVAVEKNGSMYYVHTNHRGDILALTDANGNRVATYNYGPWGELLSKTGTVDIPFRYAGYYYDQETGLYYLKARYYSSDIGRFLTKDQIEYSELKNPTTLNLYAYVNNNPVMYIDPSGHISTKLHWTSLDVYFLKSEANYWSRTLDSRADLWALVCVITGAYGLLPASVASAIMAYGNYRFPKNLAYYNGSKGVKVVVQWLPYPLVKFYKR